MIFYTALSCSPACSADAPLEKAKASLESGEIKAADYWLARYLAFHPDPRSVEELLKRRRPETAGFISHAYEPGFIDWFVSSVRRRWDVDTQRPGGTVEIARATHGPYYAAIGAAPELVYFFRPEGELASEPLVLALGAASPRPALYAGKLINGQPATGFPIVPIGTGRHRLHAVWPPEFFDLDGDGTPEIWIRYNLIWGNGFRQILSIYRIQDDMTLEPVKEFVGDSEGIARRLEGAKVEVRRGVGSRPGLSHFEYDRHHVEIWLYKGGRFKKIHQTDIPHALLDGSWKETV